MANDYSGCVTQILSFYTNRFLPFIDGVTQGTETDYNDYLLSLETQASSIHHKTNDASAYNEFLKTMQMILAKITPELQEEVAFVNRNIENTVQSMSALTVKKCQYLLGDSDEDCLFEAKKHTDVGGLNREIKGVEQNIIELQRKEELLSKRLLNISELENELAALA